MKCQEQARRDSRIAHRTMNQILLILVLVLVLEIKRTNRGRGRERRGGRRDGSWKAPFVFRMHWDHEPDWHPLPALSPPCGERVTEGRERGGSWRASLRPGNFGFCSAKALPCLEPGKTRMRHALQNF